MRHVCIAMILIMATVQSAFSQAIRVPQDRKTITLGIAAATPNVNWVEVSNYDPNDPSVAWPEAVNMVSGVPVIAAEGASPIIDAGNLATASVTWPAIANSNTRLEGFTVRGGTQKVLYVRDQGVVQNCVIDNEGTSGLTKGIDISGNTIIDGCTVLMSGNQVNYGINQTAANGWATIIDCDVTVTGSANSEGIGFSGGSPNIVNCTVDVSNGSGIHLATPQATTLGNLQGCSVAMGYGIGVYLVNGDITVSDVTIDFYHSDYNNIGMVCGYGSGSSRLDVSNCLISVPAGVGVWDYDDYADIHNVTVDNVGTGFVCPNGLNAPITNCIVTDYADGSEFAFENVNATYCIGDGTAPYDAGSQGTGSVIQDPLYCNEAAKVYTLRVDSYGNPGNNDSDELIGAFPVACMFGTLARSAEYSGNGTLYVPGDVTVPSQKTLTLGQATTVKMRGVDSLSAGSDTLEVELIVNSGATLNIFGVADHEVVFTSNNAAPAEGDWWGIMINSGGTANVDYANVSYSDYGVRYLSSTGGHISYSTFMYNAITDIWVGSGSTMAAHIDHNTIAVGGGDGVRFVSSTNGLSFTNNELVGDIEDTYSGIVFDGFFTDGTTPFISENVIQSMTSGYGIYARTAAPRIEKNDIAFCHDGVYTTGRTALIGSATDPSSDNLIHNNFIGIRAYGGTPKVRNNQITDNWYGVYAENTGMPDLGQSSSDQGKNTLTGNSTCIRNYVPTETLKAQGNWFGSCNPTICWAGLVDVSNALCSPPAGVDQPMKALDTPTRPIMHGLAPNPMRSAGRIAFSLPAASDRARVQVFDLSGRLVRDFGDSPAGAGVNEVSWDGLDGHGTPVMNGIYFIRLAVNGRDAGAAKALVVR